MVEPPLAPHLRQAPSVPEVPEVPESTRHLLCRTTSDGLMTTWDNIIVDIIGHPQQAPTFEELTFMNSRTSEEEVRDCLLDLLNKGMVETVEGDGYTFYTITEDGEREYRHEPRAAWKREYESVEKPEKIKELEIVDRPV